jgi:murein DD-endopeptidase MepM/ murein hydrolase activator NlpD
MQPAPSKVEAVKTKPGKTAQIATPAAPKPAQAALAKVVKIEAAPVTKVQQTPIKAGVDPQPTASLPPKTEASPAADANPEFRWPARGRIIQGFKSGGNDGINISVPEGTAVKAAENGVVAYAGSELKGYGNLVLIRHPNGFVSAYANNGAIEVKRGDTVKRGQTIAKSGQTGNVATPQLHFELRKGSTPVDPTNYLAGL